MAEEQAGTIIQYPPPGLLRIPMQQILLAIIALSMVAALFIGTWMWSTAPNYSVLFSNVNERDGGNILLSLQQMNVPYKFSEGGSAILVPQENVHEVRLKLASQGLPKGGLVGFEIMESQKLGLSQFIEQINYQRALEGELSRSIQSLAAVDSARVHLAIPKQSGFLRDEQKPSASVLLSLNAGRMLEANQVAGIVHLIASSVPQLSPKQVNVIDQNGNLLSADNGVDRAAGLDPAQLKYIQELETRYARRIEAILTPLVGAENFRAQVTTDVDFTQSEQVAETYRPNPTNDASIRSQQISESTLPGQGGASGIPGALSNQPPAPATAPIAGITPQAGGTANAANAGSQRRDATVNYELDKTIRHVRTPVGAVKRLSVAVIINHRKEVDKKGNSVLKPLPDAEMTKLTDLVKEATGYDQARGDSINVANSPFALVETETLPETPLWKNPVIIAWALAALKYLAAIGIVAYLYFGVLKPFLSSLIERATAEPEVPEAPVEIQQITDSTSPYEQKLQVARELARNDPKMVANVIQQWVGGNPAGKA